MKRVFEIGEFKVFLDSHPLHDIRFRSDAQDWFDVFSYRSFSIRYDNLFVFPANGNISLASNPNYVLFQSVQSVEWVEHKDNPTVTLTLLCGRYGSDALIPYVLTGERG